ncbi:MAG: hypothetical protein PUB42_07830 [Firmicutes bacterium]|nr:hypothetical protein [Bacillota bacterium]
MQDFNIFCPADEKINLPHKRRNGDFFMELKKDRPVLKENYEYDIMNSTNSVASVTECTGLIQVPPADISASESYGDIYVIPEQVNYFDDVIKPHGDNTLSAQNIPEKKR